MRAHEAEWRELEKIDYFLEHLARAVERGDVPLLAYNQLAPTYLARRRELTSIIEGVPHEAGVERLPATTPVEPVEPSLTPTGDDVQAEEPARVVYTESPAASGATPATPVAYRTTPTPSYTRPPAERAAVDWTTILMFAGAFLVIVASAIFAIATWQEISPAIRLGFLGALTAGFYGMGMYVRGRLGIPIGAVALIGVGSAMLLFDGWIVIDGYGLTGPWPWALLLLVCSIVYWATEVWLAGKLFGAVGAAAQIAWWWLMGEGLGWDPVWRLAGIAVVAVVWSFAAHAAKEDATLGSLATILRVAAPIAVVAASCGTIPSALETGIEWSVVWGAVIAGAAATMVFDWTGFPRGMAAVLHGPAIGAALYLAVDGVAWPHVLVLAGIALAQYVYEVMRGGVGHGIAALVAEASAVICFAGVMELEADAWVALLMLLAVSWVAASVMVRGFSRNDRGTLPDHTLFGYVVEVAGWMVLGAASVTVPIGFYARVSTPPDAAMWLLPLAMTAAWFATSVVARRPTAAYVGVGCAFYLLDAGVRLLAPEWLPPLYAIAVLALAFALIRTRKMVCAAFHTSDEVLVWGLRGAAFLAPVYGALGVMTEGSDLYTRVLTSGTSDPMTRSWEFAALLCAAALWWLVDSVLEDEPWLLTLSSAYAVIAVSVFVWWQQDGSLAGVAGAGSALVLVLVGLLLAPLLRQQARVWIAGATVTGTLLCLASVFDAARLATALGLCVVAWVIWTWIAKTPQLAMGAGILGVFWVLSMLAYMQAAPWFTIAAMIGVSFAMLVPLLSMRLTDGGLGLPESLAVAGLVGGVTLVILGFASRAGFPYWTGWADIGGDGLAVALAALGCYVVIASKWLDIDPGVYVGVGLIVLAYCVEMSVRDVDTLELYLVPIAVYVIWAGNRWSARTPGHPSPMATDLAGMFVGVGIPALLAVSSREWDHALWAVALALAAIGIGATVRVRAYFFGGVAALVWTAFWRSWMYLVAYWWILLGIIGIALIAVAVTWEYQKRFLRETRERFATWR